MIEAFEVTEKEDEVRPVMADGIASNWDWKVYGTLAFLDPQEPDVADRYWQRLVQVLNCEAFGNHYVRRVGHFYFSYVLAMEYPRREVVRLF